MFAEAFDLFDLGGEPELVKVIAEVTLVWVLFGDASRVRLRSVPADLGTYVRLLGVGLPLTMALGAAAAMLVLGLDPWAALLVGAALAPTDAALGATVMSNPPCPAKVRRALNVESGLNDGIATPIVLVAIAGVAAERGHPGVRARAAPWSRCSSAWRPASSSAASAASSPGCARERGLAVRGARRPGRARAGAARVHRRARWSTATASSPPSWAAWSSATSPDAAARRRSTSSSSRATWRR